MAEIVFDPQVGIVDPAPGYWPYERCISQTSVPSYVVSDSVGYILDVACGLAESGHIRHVTDAIFIAAITNTKKEMIFNLFNCDRSLITSFSQELANIINQQERTESFSEEMSPQFIRQFEDADIIRKARQSAELQVSDILLSVLYSKSPVSELMKRYGITNEKILRYCQV